MHPVLRFFLLVGLSCTCAGQAAKTPFLAQVTEQPLTSVLKSSLMISGTVDWYAGATHETGAATLTARADGSTEVMLGLNTGARADTTGPLGSRTCQWMDKNGESHPVNGANCLTPLPWFSPAILSLLTGAPGLSVTDLGEVADQGVTRHAIAVACASTLPNLPGQDLVTSATQVTIFFDTVTLLPASLTYGLHPDGADNRSIPVRVVFSDYRMVSGLSVPFHLDRYLNGTRDLSIAATSITLN